MHVHLHGVGWAGIYRTCSHALGQAGTCYAAMLQQRAAALAVTLGGCWTGVVWWGYIAWCMPQMESGAYRWAGAWSMGKRQAVCRTAPGATLRVQAWQQRVQAAVSQRATHDADVQDHSSTCRRGS